MGELYYPPSENKDADQVRGYREADLRLCFRICRLLFFCLFVFFFHEAAHLYQLRFNGFKYIYDTELWIYDLLKATTDDAPDEARTGDTSAQSPMRYQLRQSAP